MTREDWAEVILEPDLNNTPDEVQRLFETARGVMAYDYFFYPLFTLGGEQFYRVTEATSAKCESFNAPKSKNLFKDKIQFLKDNDVISDQEFQLWDSFRRMRNDSSHTKLHSLYPPEMFITDEAF